MKFSKFLAGLHNSTKATIAGCGILLVITAAALFFLMLFPIKMDERTSKVKAEPLMTYTTATTMAVTTRATTTTTTKEKPRTLSTWEVEAETLASVPDETDDGIPWYDKIFTTVTTATDRNGNIITDKNTETITIAVYTDRVYHAEQTNPDTLTLPEYAPQTTTQTKTETFPEKP